MQACTRTLLLTSRSLFAAAFVVPSTAAVPLAAASYAASGLVLPGTVTSVAEVVPAAVRPASRLRGGRIHH